MSDGDRRMHEFQAREGRLNRRVTIVGIASTLIVGVLSAVVTAHSTHVIEFFGGTPVVTQTATIAAPSQRASSSSTSPSPAPDTSGSAQATAQLPAGQAFAQGPFTISGTGIDLDRNPIETGNLTTGNADVTEQSPAGLYFYGAQNTAQWQQPGVPTQAECHRAELSNGVSNLQIDLTPFQQNRQMARFCVLTSEGRDAYLVIKGSAIVSGDPIQAQAFVWSAKIPVS